MKHLLFEIHFDSSQYMFLLLSGIISVVATVIGVQFKKYFNKQEKNAARREQKQEHHFKKVDAMFFALAMTLSAVDGEKFNRFYKERMAEMNEGFESVDK